MASACWTVVQRAAPVANCSCSPLMALKRELFPAKVVASALMQVIRDAASEPPADYYDKMGWVLIAFQNALYQLLHARSFEEGVVASAMAGGDTDTNAAICGALLGAVYGIEAVPAQWTKAVLRCRPEEGKPGVVHARPEVFWPVDAFELVDQLLGV